MTSWFIVVSGGWEYPGAPFDKAVALANKLITKGADPDSIGIKTYRSGQWITQDRWLETPMEILGRALDD